MPSSLNKMYLTISETRQQINAVNLFFVYLKVTWTWFVLYYLNIVSNIAL